MKLSILLVIAAIVLACCHSTTHPATVQDKKIGLKTDTVNVATLSDTMVAYESTCRGCAYEMSTRFTLEDSLAVVKLYDVITKDNSPAGMNGGNISKDVLIVPLKPGRTTIKVYRFYKEPETAKDSTDYSTYTIEISK